MRISTEQTDGEETRLDESDASVSASIEYEDLAKVSALHSIGFWLTVFLAFSLPCLVSEFQTILGIESLSGKIIVASMISLLITFWLTSAPLLESQKRWLPVSWALVASSILLGALAVAVGGLLLSTSAWVLAFAAYSARRDDLARGGRRLLLIGCSLLPVFLSSYAFESFEAISSGISLWQTEAMLDGVEVSHIRESDRFETANKESSLAAWQSPIQFTAVIAIAVAYGFLWRRSLFVLCSSLVLLLWIHANISSASQVFYLTPYTSQFGEWILSNTWLIACLNVIAIPIADAFLYHLMAEIPEDALGEFGRGLIRPYNWIVEFPKTDELANILLWIPYFRDRIID